MNKKMIFAITAVVVVLLLAAVGYIVINSDGTKTPNNSTSSQNTAPGMVKIQDFAFNPATITVKKGDTVTWQNSDSATHRVVSDDGTFDLGDQASGATVKFTFTKSGTFNYHCSIHSSMKGVVIVK